MEYINPDFFSKLSLNNLTCFQDFWQLPKAWFEEPNYRRNGWSGVSTHRLENSDGSISTLFVKRQENHNGRSFKYPLGRPTFSREFENINALSSRNIPSMTVVYYGDAILDGKQCAILVTEALDGYQSLVDWGKKGGMNAAGVAEASARFARQFHDAGFRHRSFYEKHLFVSQEADNPLISVIDLEKMRRGRFGLKGRVHDVRQFINHSSAFTENEWAIFLKTYLEDKPDWAVKFMARLQRLLVKKGFPVAWLSDIG